MTELLSNFVAVRRFVGSGAGTALFDPVLGKDPMSQAQHLPVPTQGVALLINAFKVSGRGLREKAAPALPSGVSLIVEPATASAGPTQRMVADVVDAGVLPPFDLVSVAGSAGTAAIVRSHPGEEPGGAGALNFNRRRSAIQASTAVLPGALA